MKIFVDYIGHSDLFYSMHALFEKRLGFEMYRPDDRDPRWESEFGLYTSIPAPNPLLGMVVETKDGVSHINSPLYEFSHKTISFEKFLEMDFDILVATGWMNEAPLLKIRNAHKPRAKLVRQLANIHEQPRAIKNVLLATTEPVGPDVNWITHYPEHLDAYHPNSSLAMPRSIKSFFNYMNTYQVEKNDWMNYQKLLPDFDFKMHGGASEHGSIPPADLPSVMATTQLIWHAKPAGCCGYTARQSLYAGKPLLVKMSYARIHNTLAKHYLQDGLNCIDLEKRSTKENVELIKRWTEPSFYEQKTLEVAAHIRQVFNFESNANDIKGWLNNLR